MFESLRCGVFRASRDARGNVGITFALSFLPAVLVAGSAIDYSRSVTQWSNLQQAADATAPTVAHAYLSKTSTGPGLTTFAQTYLNGLMKGAKLVGDPVLKQSNTVVCVQLSYVVPTTFMKIVKVDSLTVGTSACSQVGQTYEVALAVDNSGSMATADAKGVSKISALQSAAKTLVNILVPSGQTNPQVAVSIVPFTSLVNVGASAINPAIVDYAGQSSIHWQNFLRPAGGTFNPTSKFDLFSGLNVAWAGCLEELPPPYLTTDTDPATANDAKFVPYLAPDEPGSSSAMPSSYTTSASVSSPLTKAQTQTFYNSYLSANAGYKTNNLGSCSTTGKNAVYGTADAASTNTFPQGGTTMVCKYGGGTTTPTISQVTSVSPYVSGPNYECITKPVLPLTTSSTDLLSKIGTLAAGGSTNLATGFMWAWRAISPRIKAFPVVLPQVIGAQNPKSYDYGPPANQKIIILMTDGENSWFSPQNTNGTYRNAYGSLYEGMGYFSNNRIASYLSSNLLGTGACGGTYLTADNSRCALDQVTMEACTNAKNAGIIIYTIGFSVPSDPIDSDGLSLLTKCASSTSKYYLASDSSSLNSAFQAIAASILSLRLTQ